MQAVIKVGVIFIVCPKLVYYIVYRLARKLGVTIAVDGCARVI